MVIEVPMSRSNFEIIESTLNAGTRFASPSISESLLLFPAENDWHRTDLRIYAVINEAIADE